MSSPTLSSQVILILLLSTSFFQSCFVFFVCFIQYFFISLFFFFPPSPFNDIFSLSLLPSLLSFLLPSLNLFVSLFLFLPSSPSPCPSHLFTCSLSYPPSPASLTGKIATRMAGESAEFDVFLSYRVDADAVIVEALYRMLLAGTV